VSDRCESFAYRPSAQIDGELGGFGEVDGEGGFFFGEAGVEAVAAGAEESGVEDGDFVGTLGNAAAVGAVNAKGTVAVDRGVVAVVVVFSGADEIDGKHVGLLAAEIGSVRLPVLHELAGDTDGVAGAVAAGENEQDADG